MRILSTSRRQNAIYWPPATPDDFGRPAVGALVELIQIPGGANQRVRWVHRTEEIRDAVGTKVDSVAMVSVPQLANGDEIALGGWLWLGDRVDLTSETVPSDNVGAYQIMKVEKIPTLRATQFLRRVYL